jgi:hypothetical protein
LGALVGGLGCSPLDDGAYPPPSHCRLTLAYSEFGSVRYSFRRPYRFSGSTPPGTRRRCASTHFGENQLALGSIGISPLTTAHPMILQHQPVRPSTWLYPSFSLAMVRSPRFGSTACDLAPSSDSVSLWLRHSRLNLPHTVTRWLILQQARGHPFNRAPTACRHTVSCSLSLPSRGSFHLSLTVLVHYRSHRSI